MSGGATSSVDLHVSCFPFRQLKSKALAKQRPCSVTQSTEGSPLFLYLGKYKVSSFRTIRALSHVLPRAAKRNK